MGPVASDTIFWMLLVFDDKRIARQPGFKEQQVGPLRATSRLRKARCVFSFQSNKLHCTHTHVQHYGQCPWMAKLSRRREGIQPAVGLPSADLDLFDVPAEVAAGST